MGKDSSKNPFVCFILLRRIPSFHLNFVKRYSFRIVLPKSHETLQKLRLSKKYFTPENQVKSRYFSQSFEQTCYRPMFFIIPTEHVKQPPVFWYFQMAQKKAEEVKRSCFVKKVLLKISQNSQENTCVQVFRGEFCEIFIEHL